MVSPKGSFVVTVKGQYNDFSEPYIQFGHNSETVKYYVKNSDQLIRDEDTLLIYKGSGKIEYTIIISTIRNWMAPTSLHCQKIKAKWKTGH